MYDSSGNDLSLLEQVAYCARVSNPANQNNHDSSERLCDYLLKHHHYSPFEMVNICVEIETTRDIGRQILRHRSFTFQEFSQRYAEATDFTVRECRLQHEKNRQQSVELTPTSVLDQILQDQFTSIQQELIGLEKKYYGFCMMNNIAKEQARCILSEGLTKTRMYMNGTLRSWIHYIQIRTDRNTTQKEHCDVAIKIAAEIEKVFPQIRNFIHVDPQIPADVKKPVEISKRRSGWLGFLDKMFFYDDEDDDEN